MEKLQFILFKSIKCAPRDITDLIASYISTHIKTATEEYTLIDGNKEGEYKKYYKSGALYIHCTYHRDLLHGKYLRYNESGDIEIQGFYNNGVKHGEFKLGKEIQTYRNGKLI
jgi:antitoxin component YwqK of YwqJK toxin-antitoxin module